MIGANVTEDSRLGFVEIGHAGGGSANPASLLLEAPIGVENSRFYASAGYGVLKRADDTTDYTADNRFEDTASDPVGTY